MLRCLQTFLRDETGAAGTDWVMLTAGAVMLGLTAVTAVKAGSVEVGEGMVTHISVSNGD
ncbi:MAG: hypothetical protein RIA08_05250 [Roseovarius sp.]|uniref:hypothetical protein n=1 Tax=Roseobacteraceae TaxID=2854170 RepID=UPI0032EF76BA